MLPRKCVRIDICGGQKYWESFLGEAMSEVDIKTSPEVIGQSKKMCTQTEHRTRSSKEL